MRDLFEEQAAISEFDDGQPREEAEAYALLDGNLRIALGAGTCAVESYSSLSKRVLKSEDPL